MSAQTVYQPAVASDSDGNCMKEQRATATILQERLASSSYVCPESAQERNSGPHRPEQQWGGQATALQQGRPKTAIIFIGRLMQSGFKEINKCTTEARILGLLLPKSRFLAWSRAGPSLPSNSHSSPEQFPNVIERSRWEWLCCPLLFKHGNASTWRSNSSEQLSIVFSSSRTVITQ